MDNLLLAAPDSGKGSAGHGELTEAQVLLVFAKLAQQAIDLPPNHR